jgi:hypothetical protein
MLGQFWQQEMEMLKDFYNKLTQADWFAGYSDDSGVRNRGEARLAELKTEAEGIGPQAVALFEAYRDHKWRGAQAPAVPE